MTARQAADVIAPAFWPGGVLVDRVLRHHPEYARHIRNHRSSARFCDFIVATPKDGLDPVQIFHRLRWGGLLAFVSADARQVAQLARQFTQTGFDLEIGPTFARKPVLGMPLPLISSKAHYFIARKVHLIAPGEISDRFTYNVRLIRRGGLDHPMVVLKEVPSTESVVARLRNKFPDVPLETIERRARKFTEKIFPTFLTREAGTLKILQEHLPSPYNRRVPRVIDLETDDRGFVRKLWMNWLRNGGKPLPQMEFAHQAADLLRVVHDIAHVIHLDLRLDNFVITEHGVGFVDFGSAVRDNENLSENPLLATLFDELMRTSQIQRMLSQMTISGQVTSNVIRNSHQKIDKAIDFFYLALQFNCPHTNPELADLIQFDASAQEARDLARLTELILRPPDPTNPPFRSAKDILHGIDRIRLRLDKKKPATHHAAS